MPTQTFEEYLKAVSPLLRMLGKKPPLEEEVEMARTILAEAPRGQAPIVAARYFEAVTHVNKDGDPYTGEWPVRANPVIVHLFVATTTLPAGDTTPWCAAFLNYCLQLSGKTGTKSASSGTFRCAGLEATRPSVGDVAVFGRHTDTAKCAGRGHVAFFISDLGAHVRVLGGNQSDRVKQSDYQRDGNPRFLTVRDVRTIS